MTDYKKSKSFDTFQIIRHRGSPDKGQLPDGSWVYKVSKFWVSSDGLYIGTHPRSDDDRGRYIPAAPYNDHFLYLAPPKYPGSSIRCSCGGFGCFSGASGYILDASIQGQLALCWHHATYGYHIGGGRWI